MTDIVTTIAILLFLLGIPAAIVMIIIQAINKPKLRKKLQDENVSLTTRNAQLQAENDQLAARIKVLGKYEQITDAEKRAAEIIDKAYLHKKSIEAANSILEEEGSQIIAEARRKAEALSAEAIKAIRQAETIERTADAMRNVIRGYGDQYIIPSFNLLDDLADELQHTNAGDKLKEARKYTRKLIKDGNAATCDYSEPVRRSTAINFVIDAFNGKVDSILSKIRNENYGTLQQQIKDAYYLVNNNGQAFRNAAITQTFLYARLDELQWAIVALEIKMKAQEEQRQIKERMREEEKARRDYERAMKEAQKEEETLKRLIEKAQREVSTATEGQRIAFETKLAELEAKLSAAEEKNQRALSMAQQTRAGNVYIISNIGSFGENVYKIGMTRRLEPLDRVRELGDASVPFEFDVHAMIYCEDAPKLEKELHRKFLNMQMNKINPRKEFFKVPLLDIKKQVEGQGIEVHWTLEAEARQYRETKALEEALVNDQQKRREWEAHQLQMNEVMTELEEEAA